MASLQFLRRSNHTIGWICALPVEASAARAMVGRFNHRIMTVRGDPNSYSSGKIGNHNIVISTLPAGKHGTTAAGLARTLRAFPKLQFGLVVGSEGTVPNSLSDIRPGDIVVSLPPSIFKVTPNASSSALLAPVAAMKSRNKVQLGQYISKTVQDAIDLDSEPQFTNLMHPTRQDGGPHIHFRTIPSGKQAMAEEINKSSINAETVALDSEIEAADFQVIKEFPCLIIRGIYDFAKKNDRHNYDYAALVAAAYAKILIQSMTEESLVNTENGANYYNGPEKASIDHSFEIPFPRNYKFTGRDKELDSIRQYFFKLGKKGKPRALLIAGPGGIGKSEIAIEYAHRKSHNHYNYVFWVNAKSETSIYNSFLEILQRIVHEQVDSTQGSAVDYNAIGSKIGISGILDRKGVITAPVSLEDKHILRSALFNWLQMTEGWLYVLDGADDSESLPLADYIPKGGNGSVLITSRQSNILKKSQRVDVEVLDHIKAVGCFLSHMGSDNATEGTANPSVLNHSAKYYHLPGDIENLEDVDTLVAKLASIPRAIVQAARFIRETRVPILVYIEDYDERLTALQSRMPDKYLPTLDDKILITWEISFSEVERRDPDAAKLLLALSYFDGENITLEQLERCLGNKLSPGESKSMESTVLDKVRVLESFSLIKLTSNEKVVLHPAVHLWVHEQLGRMARLQNLTHAISLLGKILEGSEATRSSARADTHEVQSAVSHLHHFEKYRQDALSEIFELEWLETLDEKFFITAHKISQAFMKENLFDQSLEWLQFTVSGFDRLLGKDNSRSILANHHIGNVLWAQSKKEEALKIYGQVLPGYMRILKGGEPGVSIPDLKRLIASIHQDRGDTEAAINWYKQALADTEGTEGKETLDTLNISFSLGNMMFERKNYNEALLWLIRAFKGYQETLGPANMKALYLASFIVRIYGLQGKFEEALEWNIKAHEISEDMWGANHVFTLDRVGSMGAVLSELGRHEEALEWAERGYAGFKETLGENDPMTIIAGDALAEIKRRRGDIR